MIAMRPDDGNADSDDPIDRVSNRVQAAASFFAPTDFLNFIKAEEDFLTFLRRSGSALPAMFYEFNKQTRRRRFVEDEERQRELLRHYSPITYASADDPPTILIHGEEDSLVPAYQSVRLSERLHNLGVDVKLVVRKGNKHAWDGWEDERALIADWFDEHLR